MLRCDKGSVQLQNTFFFINVLQHCYIIGWAVQIFPKVGNLPFPTHDNCHLSRVKVNTSRPPKPMKPATASTRAVSQGSYSLRRMRYLQFFFCITRFDRHSRLASATGIDTRQRDYIISSTQTSQPGGCGMIRIRTCNLPTTQKALINFL